LVSKKLNFFVVSVFCKLSKVWFKTKSSYQNQFL